MGRSPERDYVHHRFEWLMATEDPTVASPSRRTGNSELILDIVSFDMGRAPMKDLACGRFALPNPPW